MTQDELKQAVARAALDYVVEGKLVGVGTGSTARLFIEALAGMKDRITGAVASSEDTQRRLEGHGIKVFDLNDITELPVYIDGADEINVEMHMIKGGGGALTREKIVSAVAKKFVCIVDGSKLVEVLGTFPLPVEVIPMARAHVARELSRLGGIPVLREGPFRPQTPAGSPSLGQSYRLDPPHSHPRRLPVTVAHAPVRRLGRGEPLSPGLPGQPEILRRQVRHCPHQPGIHRPPCLPLGLARHTGPFLPVKSRSISVAGIRSTRLLSRTATIFFRKIIDRTRSTEQESMSAHSRRVYASLGLSTFIWPLVLIYRASRVVGWHTAGAAGRFSGPHARPPKDASGSRQVFVRLQQFPQILGFSGCLSACHAAALV